MAKTVAESLTVRFPQNIVANNPALITRLSSKTLLIYSRNEASVTLILGRMSFRFMLSHLFRSLFCTHTLTQLHPDDDFKEEFSEARVSVLSTSIHHHDISCRAQLLRLMETILFNYPPPFERHLHIFYSSCSIINNIFSI